MELSVKGAKMLIESTDTILVTGGAGFIGSNFVFDWIEKIPGQIINLDKLTYAGNRHNLDALAGNSRHIFIRGDICDTDLIEEILRKYRPRAVINFAAESHVDRSIHNPDEFVRTNVQGTLNLLEKARQYWCGLTPLATLASDFCTFHQTKSTALWGRRSNLLPRRRLMLLIAPTQPQKQQPITLSVPGIIPMACPH